MLVEFETPDHRFRWQLVGVCVLRYETKPPPRQVLQSDRPPAPAQAAPSALPAPLALPALPLARSIAPAGTTRTRTRRRRPVLAPRSPVRRLAAARRAGAVPPAVRPQPVPQAVLHRHHIIGVVGLFRDVAHRHNSIFPAVVRCTHLGRLHDCVPLGSTMELAVHVLRRNCRDAAHEVRLPRHPIGAERHEGVDKVVRLRSDATVLVNRERDEFVARVAGLDRLEVLVALLLLRFVTVDAGEEGLAVKFAWISGSCLGN